MALHIRRVEVWSQGQDEDSRFWFPCFDYPNEKQTTEVIATVPTLCHPDAPPM